MMPMQPRRIRPKAVGTTPDGAPAPSGAQGTPSVDVRQMAGEKYRGAMLRRMGRAVPQQAPGAPSLVSRPGGGASGQLDISGMLKGILGSRVKRRVLGGGQGPQGQQLSR